MEGEEGGASGVGGGKAAAMEGFRPLTPPPSERDYMHAQMGVEDSLAALYD